MHACGVHRGAGCTRGRVRGGDICVCPGMCGVHMQWGVVRVDGGRCLRVARGVHAARGVPRQCGAVRVGGGRCLHAARGLRGARGVQAVWRGAGARWAVSTCRAWRACSAMRPPTSAAVALGAHFKPHAAGSPTAPVAVHHTLGASCHASSYFTTTASVNCVVEPTVVAEVPPGGCQYTAAAAAAASSKEWRARVCVCVHGVVW